MSLRVDFSKSGGVRVTFERLTEGSSGVLQMAGSTLSCTTLWHTGNLGCGLASMTKRQRIRGKQHQENNPSSRGTGVQVHRAKVPVGDRAIPSMGQTQMRSAALRSDFLTLIVKAQATQGPPCHRKSALISIPMAVGCPMRPLQVSPADSRDGAGPWDLCTASSRNLI
jgi:hypothetical protein